MSGIEELDVNLFEVFMLLYVDDIVIFSINAEEFQVVLIYYLNIVKDGA